MTSKCTEVTEIEGSHGPVLRGRKLVGTCPQLPRSAGQGGVDRPGVSSTRRERGGRHQPLLWDEQDGGSEQVGGGRGGGEGP